MPSASILHLRRPAFDGPPVDASDRPRSTPAALRRSIRPHHVALALLLALTALTYLWDLRASGDANSFYAAAVQAGTRSWKAFFFGSLDSSNFITVDKPPASLWVMALSGRIFGFSSWSMLVPQALEGVAAVALLAASVRRWFGAGAGIGAGALLAVTPIAAVMFRFNNPDALLVLALVASAYCLVRALERGATRWILAAGALVGFAFLAKMLQAFVVLPGFALVYLLAAPVAMRRRVWQTLAAGCAVVVGCGWWLAAVALWPVADRPMIDGSSTNNIFNLILGYNGLGRVFGGDSNGGGGGGGGIGHSFSGDPGVLRLFNSMMGGQASWLIPAALIALVAGLIARRRAPRTDRVRAALLLWGSWLVVTGLVFSLSSGIIHTYYTVALAPAIGGLVAIGAWQAWGARTDRRVQALVALTVIVTAAWSIVLLGRTPSFDGWLVWLIAVCGVAGLAALSMWASGWPRGGERSWLRRIGVAGAVLASVACLAGPVAYTVDSVTTAHTGSTPSAGPATSGGGFGGGGGGGGSSRGGAARFGGGGSATISLRGGPGSSSSSSHGGGGGGIGGSASVSSALRTALKADAGKYKWVAATSGSQSAASYELATGGEPVMAIGGFSGEGGNISLTQFKKDVARGEIHYYIVSSNGAGGGGGGASVAQGGSARAGGPDGSSSTSSGRSGTTPPGQSRSSTRGGGHSFGSGGMGGSGSTSSTITKWVEGHFTERTIGGTTVYVLTSPKS